MSNDPYHLIRPYLDEILNHTAMSNDSDKVLRELIGEHGENTIMATLKAYFRQHGDNGETDPHKKTQ